VVQNNAAVRSVPEAIFLIVRRMEIEAGYSADSSLEAKNVWILSFAPPYLLVCRLL
jgi:hypothetical protein